ncbi:hypothetical protein KIN20_008351 [Parelaphostrongylus tenuis]|uniref:Rho-GAP domain-containing protein n=1 Tax=Parelaphostrongylus tenuis TaxID=148309 RepID=A0AAD5M7V8_PARTN|nr:hypothetical protein KIN20_008351 [Parelaphostrongylus tenuis]
MSALYCLYQGPFISTKQDKNIGLFRVIGNSAKIRRMKAAFDAGQIDTDKRAYYLDPHSVCSALKSYLKELPDSLLTHRLHNDWVNASKLVVHYLDLWT